MWKTLSFVLPVLVPSWQFFKTVEASPRIQWALLSTGDVSARDWHAFRPRPTTISPLQMGVRLFWNPQANDILFAVSCAERIQQSPDPHSIAEIRRRILSDLAKLPIDTTGKSLQFRLVFVHGAGAELSSEVVFLSQVTPIENPSEC